MQLHDGEIYKALRTRELILRGFREGLPFQEVQILPASVDLRYAKAFAASNPDENLIRAWREKGRDGQTQVPAPISPGA